MKAVNKAYDILRAGIIEGTYPPGSRVTEQEIALASGVSRTPVREAMGKLQAEGLLQVLPHQGAVVRTWSDSDAEEIFELRALVESYVVQRAAERASSEELAELRRAAEEQYAEVCSRKAGYMERIADVNDRFHKLLQNAARSERLKTILATLAEAPLVFETFRDYSEEELQRSARHHLEIVEALECGDQTWAASVMRSHVLAARTTFRRMKSDAKKSSSH